MKRSNNKMLTLSALAFAMIAGACDNASMGAAGMDPSPMVVMSTTGETYVVAQEDDPNAGSISAEIGAAGGQLSLGPNKLYVSAGAVSEVTTFTMTRNPESPIRVDLNATRVTANDIGAAGFAAPVKLELGYLHADNLPENPSELKLMYFRPDGLVEILPTTVDMGAATISADLPHFSLFGLGWP